MRPDIAPGGTFPDYELTDHAKTRRRLSELQGNDPMILVLARGHYCPKDHQQHLELAALQPQIAVAYTRVVTISTDNIVETRSDWDINTPAQRAAWDAGDRSGFFHDVDLDPSLRTAA